MYLLKQNANARKNLNTKKEHKRFNLTIKDIYLTVRIKCLSTKIKKSFYFFLIALLFDREYFIFIIVKLN